MPKIQNWPMNPTWFRTTLTLAAATALAGGCVVSRSSSPRVEKAVTSSTDFSRGDALQKIDAEELNQLTNAFADRYRTLMEDAVNEIITGNPDARQRALANRFLVESTTSDGGRDYLTRVPQGRRSSPGSAATTARRLPRPKVLQFNLQS
jgi:hypothetical protein